MQFPRINILIIFFFCIKTVHGIGQTTQYFCSYGVMVEEAELNKLTVVSTFGQQGCTAFCQLDQNCQALFFEKSTARCYTVQKNEIINSMTKLSMTDRHLGYAACISVPFLKHLYKMNNWTNTEPHQTTTATTENDPVNRNEDDPEEDKNEDLVSESNAEYGSTPANIPYSISDPGNFTFNNNYVNWPTAFNSCLSINKRLVVIDSLEKQNFLVNNVIPKGTWASPWFDLSVSGIKYPQTWVINKTIEFDSSKFRYWANAKDETGYSMLPVAAYMNPSLVFKWSKAFQGSLHSYICEVKLI